MSKTTIIEDTRVEKHQEIDDVPTRDVNCRFGQRAFIKNMSHENIYS